VDSVVNQFPITGYSLLDIRRNGGIVEEFDMDPPEKKLGQRKKRLPHFRRMSH
jgi:hypothetical protein